MPVRDENAKQWDAVSVAIRLRCSVIPLLGGSDVQAGKRPAIRWLEYSRRTPSPHELHRWFAVDGHSAFGVVCGRISRLVVLDIDDPQLAGDFVEAFPPLVDTLVVESGVRGTPHFYWRVNYPVASCAFPGGDLKGEGGYVVGPGSQIGPAHWQVAIDRPIRAISYSQLQAVLHFFQKRQPEPQPSTPAVHPTKNADDFVALYHYYVSRYRSRNQALFQTGCHVRDHGHSQEWAVAVLAAVHAAEPACDQHPAESYSRRYAEALRTLRSVYTRPPRAVADSADAGQTVSRLPNSLRETLLARPDGPAVARVIEAAVLHGVAPEAPFTEADLCRVLHGIASRATIRKALAAQYGAQMPIFPPCTPPTGVDTNVEPPRQKSAFLSPGQKQTKRLYQLPDVAVMCAGFGIKVTAGDPIYPADVASVRAYRQALHREFIRRRPGRYSQALLGRRVSVSSRTIARYNQRMPICSEPTFIEKPLCWENLDQVLPGEDCGWQGGRFLMDQTGKKWPPRREIARKLLKKRLAVSSMVRGVNYYYYQRMPGVEVGNRSDAGVSVGTPTLAPACPPQPIPSAGQAVWEYPEIAQEGPLQPSLPLDPVSIPEKPQKRLKKRFFHQMLPDGVMESVAEELYRLVKGLSVFNARRLVYTYGVEIVRPVLRRFQWLHRRGKINNPAGFILTALRVEWRAANDWLPAPALRLEPKRRPRPC